MSDGSKIEWLHVAGKKAATLNPTTGCTKVSPGCKHCYAKREWVRLSANPKSVYYGRQFEDVQMHPERLQIPILMTKPRRFFVDSMSDMFHDAITDEFLDAFFAMVERCTHHTFIVLTKRSERLRDYYGRAYGRSIGWMPHLQLGVSVESREYLDRLDHLRELPAAVRVLSAEPLLEDLGALNLKGIHQVYAGGETGPKSRPSAPAWFRSLRDECERQGTAFHFKQWGDWAPPRDVPQESWKPRHDYVDGEYVMRVGKKNAGRRLDGIEHNELVS